MNDNFVRKGMQRFGCLSIMGMMCLGMTAGVHAEENLWLYTKGTDTRPEGSTELKISNTTRIGKNGGDYVFHDIRPEIEYGFTDRLTIGAELMIFDHDYSVSSSTNPMHETQGGDNGRFKKTQVGGYEISAKYNWLSPYKDVLGVSFGLGYEKRSKYRLDGADISQHAFVGTIFLQKNWLDDTLVWAFNSKTELELRHSESQNEEDSTKWDRVMEKEISLDFSTGISYRVAPKHFVGFEMRHQSDYLNPNDSTQPGDHEDHDLKESDFGLAYLKLGSQHQNGLYMGPTYHFAEKNWWVTVGALMQVAGGGSEHADVRDGKNWDEHERFHLGVSYGYEF
jgi:hypothetical protein